MIELDIIQEILEDADIFGYIRAGAYVDVYDKQAKFIKNSLSKDLTLSQIQNLIWNAFYNELCICKIGKTNQDFVLDKQSAIIILGSPARYKDIAKLIRDFLEF